MKHELNVNGSDVALDIGPLTTLLSVLRQELRLTGAKEACGRGECGACTVFVGDDTVNACTTLVWQVHQPVTTIEGLIEESRDIREAFADHGAFQCGFCTPGQVVRCTAILRDADIVADEDLSWLLAGNICRCTGYAGILDAVEEVLAARRQTGATR